MTPHVESLTTVPAVGSYYLVKCVKRLHDGYMMPILGPMHEDAEFINFPTDHWHIDFRFLEDCRFEVQRRLGRTPFGHVVTAPAYETLKVQTLRRKCRRLMPSDYPHADWRRPLEKKYASRTLCAGKVCPHRGIPLAGIPADEHGIVVCPGHGLCWDVNSGKLHPLYGSNQP